MIFLSFPKVYSPTPSSFSPLFTSLIIFVKNYHFSQKNAMNLNLKLIFVGLLFLSANCGSTSEEDQKLLKEAAAIHLEAVELEQQVKPKLDELIQQKNSINIQGRSLTAQELAFAQKVESIENSYAYWEENHVEVPGHGHDGHEGHDHGHEGHNHDHGHDAKLEVSAADMLLIQKEFKDSILSIQQRIEQLKVPVRPKFD